MTGQPDRLSREMAEQSADPERLRSLTALLTAIQLRLSREKHQAGATRHD
jgi:hypothetical protein